MIVQDEKNYIIETDDFKFKGVVGELVEEKGISIKVDSISAQPGTSFTVSYVSKLKAISDIQEQLTVSDQGKDTGILILSLIGDNPKLIEDIIDSISNNYLAQNISRQAAQDEKKFRVSERSIT